MQHFLCWHGRHLLVSGDPPTMTQVAKLLRAAHPYAKVPHKTAPGWAVAFLAKYKSKKLGFDLPKFRSVLQVDELLQFAVKPQIKATQSLHTTGRIYSN